MPTSLATAKQPERSDITEGTMIHCLASIGAESLYQVPALAEVAFAPQKMADRGVDLTHV